MQPNADSASVSRRILVVARNHTAVNWINELLPALVADFRIQTYFSIPTTQSSLWTNGVEATLRSTGAIQVPWDSAVAEEFAWPSQQPISGILNVCARPSSCSLMDLALLANRQSVRMEPSRFRR